MWRSNIPVAIKQMKLQYEEDSDEFISEAQLLISLKQYVYIYTCLYSLGVDAPDYDRILVILEILVCISHCSPLFVVCCAIALCHCIN